MTEQPSLDRVPTSELHAELLRREGISAIFLGPKDEITKHIQGPAWVIINRD